MPDTHLIAIRHGETLWNRQGRLQGDLDSALTTEGRAQADALGQRLGNEAFDHLYSSDLGRAVATARAVAARSGHALLTDARLRERHLGIFGGLTETEIAHQYPAEWTNWNKRDPTWVVPGGESLQQAQQRAIAAFTGLAARHQGQTLAAICHGGILALLYRHAKGMTLQAPRDYSLHNASINRFRYAEGRWDLLTWGDISHLAESVADDID